ncbi:MAG TPA: 7-cyano-7-deazaguanine synthase [bacterium]|nr:7-cyano-7-deazaguanine synthase [bacterium]
MNAVVLLSGGLDSTTTLGIALREGYQVHALSFDYGQRHRIVRVDLTQFGGSALTADIAVPKNGLADDGKIPITYVPARNTVFLALALAFAETVDARDIFLGVNALDYSGYPDCRPEYLQAFERLANLATRVGVESKEPWFRLHAPLMHMTKADIVRQASSLGLDLSRTVSCYDPGPAGEPCGQCDSCRLRAKGFAEAGVEDPAAPTDAPARPETR